MSVGRTCDVCHRSHSEFGRAVVPVHRFSIRRYVYKGRFESAGSIDLCERCWEDIAKPRMRPQRRPKAKREAESG